MNVPNTMDTICSGLSSSLYSSKSLSSFFIFFYTFYETKAKVAFTTPPYLGLTFRTRANRYPHFRRKYVQGSCNRKLLCRLVGRTCTYIFYGFLPFCPSRNLRFFCTVVRPQDIVLNTGRYSLLYFRPVAITPFSS